MHRHCAGGIDRHVKACGCQQDEKKAAPDEMLRYRRRRGLGHLPDALEAKHVNPAAKFLDYVLATDGLDDLSGGDSIGGEMPRADHTAEGANG